MYGNLKHIHITPRSWTSTLIENTPPSRTSTVTVTATLSQASVSLETSVVSIFSTETDPVTITEPITVSTTSVATDLETTMVTDTISTTFPAVVTQTVFSTETAVVTVTQTLLSTTTILPAKRAISTEVLVGIPAYAAACRDSSAYSRACRCIGVKATTVTAAKPTTTVTVTQTQVYPTESVIPSSLTVVVTAMPTSTVVVTSVETVQTTTTVQVTQTTDVFVSFTSTSTSTDFESTTVTSTATTSLFEVVTTTAAAAANPTFTMSPATAPGQYVKALEQNEQYEIQITTSAASAAVFTLDSDGHLLIPSLGLTATASGGSNSYNLGLVFLTAERIEFATMFEDQPPTYVTFVVANGEVAPNFFGFDAFCGTNPIFLCSTATAPASAIFHMQYTLL